MLQLANCAHGRRANLYPMHLGSVSNSAKSETVITHLLAKRCIVAGEELFWDYEATCTSREEEIKCACGCKGGYVARYYPL